MYLALPIKPTKCDKKAIGKKKGDECFIFYRVLAFLEISLIFYKNLKKRKHHSCAITPYHIPNHPFGTQHVTNVHTSSTPMVRSSYAMARLVATHDYRENRRVHLLPDQRRSRGAAGVSCVNEQGQQASPSIRKQIRRYAVMSTIEGLDGRDRYIYRCREQAEDIHCCRPYM